MTLSSATQMRVIRDCSVTDFLCDGLGFDKYEDLTCEYQVKGDFADYGIRIDKQMIAFVEVKRCTQSWVSSSLGRCRCTP
jgi:hypothetical protein